MGKAKLLFEKIKKFVEISKIFSKNAFVFKIARVR